MDKFVPLKKTDQKKISQLQIFTDPPQIKTKTAKRWSTAPCWSDNRPTGLLW